ncbi:MAG: type I methionyl aminopeptidase [Candidatus Omnitrophica bacterium]|nr:type I methionyl aminopeptidase [Candidatus Omnitrophota bacterium]
MIPLKSEKDLVMLRESGRILAKVLRQLCEYVRPGISTAQIDNLAEQLISETKGKAAFKGYKGFPASVCTSVNEEIVHGIPGPRVLLEGDILSLDLGINYQGYFSDAAVTVPVGRVDFRSSKLIEVTRKSLSEGIRRAKADNHLSDISHAIQGYVEARGFSVVRQFVGHGIGVSLHEEPEIPNFGAPHKGVVLKNGMVLAIEPMVNAGGWESKISDNSWTALTKDGLRSAHFEHTVAIIPGGPEILTA